MCWSACILDCHCWPIHSGHFKFPLLIIQTCFARIHCKHQPTCGPDLTVSFTVGPGDFPVTLLCLSTLWGVWYSHSVSHVCLGRMDKAQGVLLQLYTNGSITWHFIPKTQHPHLQFLGLHSFYWKPLSQTLAAIHSYQGEFSKMRLVLFYSQSIHSYVYAWWHCH